MGLFGKIAEKRTLTQLSPMFQWERDFPYLMHRTHSGKHVSHETALRMVAVWSCVGLIADGISTLPTDVFVALPDGRKRPVTAPSWVRQPNPFQTTQDFWHRVLVSLLLDGNAFISTIRDDKGNIKALYVLEPRSVFIEQGNGGDDRYVIGNETFDRSQILHIPAFSVPGFSRGLSPIDMAREAIGLGLTAEEFGARFFSQGTTMAGVIQHPGNPKPDEAKLLRQMFRKTHAGVKNSHAVGVLTGGATWQSITVPPEAAQFLESRNFQKVEVALLYRVPAYMVDPSVSTSWGKGIEEMNKWFVDQTLMPWVVRIEQAISTKLLPGKQYFKFNLDARLRAATKDRFDSYAVALQNGIMNPDEVRALEDLDPIPDGLGTQFFHMANVVPMGSEDAGDANNPTDPADTKNGDGETTGKETIDDNVNPAQGNGDIVYAE